MPQGGIRTMPAPTPWCSGMTSGHPHRAPQRLIGDLGMDLGGDDLAVAQGFLHEVQVPVFL